MKPAFDSLIHLLAHRAETTPQETAFIFEEQSHSYGELWQAVNRFADVLQQEGLQPGDAVVLCLPNGPDFFTAFYGVQRAGGIPAPIGVESGPARIATIAGLCQAGTIVLDSALSPDFRAAVCDLCRPEGRAVVTVADTAPESDDASFPAVSGDAIALLQYTSGSTGDPKGVELSHAAILTNLAQMRDGMAITPQEVFVSWLPLHHDMGLILLTMMPFFVGARLVLLPTRQASTRHWFQAIQDHRGTFTAAPDFSYRLCLANRERLGDYDLSSLRVALNAAEPVRAGTVVAFEETFGLGHVMRPAYGLAEATVGVSMWPPLGQPVKVDDHGFVAVGSGFPGCELAIRGPDGQCPAGTVGEITVRSPSATRGYLGNPAATQALFMPDGYFHTGDLGYLDPEGDLFVVGRSKNIIIQAGRNIAPQEVEETVDPLACVRRSAAVGIERRRQEGDQLYIFVEWRGPHAAEEEQFEEATRSIVQALHTRMGLRPARVYFLRHGAIPRTDTGKTRYGDLRARYMGGALREANMILFPGY
ncbi:MAG: AMP-binding protein [Verrucomicrobia bacterium]|nr:AMP-binding protein [Verrucomicrobiota bacterium]MBT7065767.1 AMP-binding protein [Verrucomicrobiota bacterium]MBT7700685.1 AMP-binding protein [Verrucomicrobiota bacterium]